MLLDPGIEKHIKIHINQYDNTMKLRVKKFSEGGKPDDHYVNVPNDDAKKASKPTDTKASNSGS
jgi:hypothetical protein